MKKTPLEIVLLLVTLITLSDILNLYSIRRLLLDFLIGARNRKNAYLIHSEQSPKEKITLLYIEPLIKKHKLEFRHIHRCYIVLSCYVLFQIIFIISLIGVFNTKMISRIILCVISAINGIVFIILRAQFDASWVSRYAKKK